MLKPFRIRDLLIPTDEEELDHPRCRPQDGQDGSKPIPRSHTDGELVMAYKQPNNGDDGKFCPYSTYDLQSIPSTDADGRTAKKGIDILIPSKPPSDRNDMSSNLRRNKWTNATVTPSPATDRHGIVRVSAEEYDKTIAAHPQSKLTYMDEDDGDTITVGCTFLILSKPLVLKNCNLSWMAIDYENRSVLLSSLLSALMSPPHQHFINQLFLAMTKDMKGPCTFLMLIVQNLYWIYGEVSRKGLLWKDGWIPLYQLIMKPLLQRLSMAIATSAQSPYAR